MSDKYMRYHSNPVHRKILQIYHCPQLQGFNMASLSFPSAVSAPHFKWLYPCRNKQYFIKRFQSRCILRKTYMSKMHRIKASAENSYLFSFQFYSKLIQLLTVHCSRASLTMHCAFWFSGTLLLPLWIFLPSAA